MSARFRVVPLELSEANAFVSIHHRHHAPTQGHRFSIGAEGVAGLVGVAIVGRPVARRCNQRTTVEVTRLCTDGTEHACSFLYAACARIAHSLGYENIQTYTLPNESGASLRAAGWTMEGLAGGGIWKHTDGRPRRTDQPTERKLRWTKRIGIVPELEPSDAR